jgi:hypothetical protein
MLEHDQTLLSVLELSFLLTHIGFILFAIASSVGLGGGGKLSWLQVPYKAENFLTNSETISIGRTVHHEDIYLLEIKLLK